jgi:hypothetical protein
MSVRGHRSVHEDSARFEEVIHIFEAARLVVDNLLKPLDSNVSQGTKQQRGVRDNGCVGIM